MDAFKIIRGTPGDALHSLAIKEDDYIIFREMAKTANVKQVDLFKSMVKFCAERFEVLEEDNA